jgi:hypothetical protein
VSLGGVLAVLAVVPLLPLLLPKIWAMRVDLPAARPAVTVERPAFLVLSLLVLVTMVALFLFGESLPVHIVPPQVAIIAAALALLVIYGVRIEPVGEVIRDVDWKKCEPAEQFDGHGQGVQFSHDQLHLFYEQRDDLRLASSSSTRGLNRSAESACGRSPRREECGQRQTPEGRAYHP